MVPIHIMVIFIDGGIQICRAFQADYYDYKLLFDFRAVSLLSLIFVYQEIKLIKKSVLVNCSGRAS